MSIKTILVLFHGDLREKHTLEEAIALGRRYNARITCLHISPDPKAYGYAAGPMIPVKVGEEFRESIQREADKRATSARQQFVNICEQHDIKVMDEPSMHHGVSARWLRDKGSIEESVALHGRLADMILISRDISKLNHDYGLALSAALFDTGRPLVIVPPDQTVKILDNIAIACDGSARAARAMTTAIPLLEPAQRIILITVGVMPENTPLIRDVESYLYAHHIQAEHMSIAPKGLTTGATLMETALAEGCDMLVMGAYTHSRLRQMVIGGVTSFMLEHAEMPVFMVH